MGGKQWCPLPHDSSLEIHRLFHRDETSWAHLLHDPAALFPIDSMGLYPVYDGTECGSISVADLSRLDRWPLKAAPFLRTDAFISINSFYRPGEQCTDALRALNAAWVDCDCYGLDENEALALVSEAERQEVIPQPSLIQCNGSGLWLFWLLKDDEDASQPPHAKWLNRTRLRGLNKELCERLGAMYPALEPDRQAVDAARHHRIAGSHNTGANWPVQFVRPAQCEEIRYFTLDELGTFLGVAAPESSRTAAARSGRSSRKVAVSRLRRKHVGYLKEFWAYIDSQPKIREGEPSRNAVVNVYAYLLAMSGEDKKTVEREAIRFGRERCSPPLAECEARAQARSALKNVKKILDPNLPDRTRRNRTLARSLGIRAHEAERLGLRSLRPDYVKPLPRGETRRRHRRRHLLRQLSERRGRDGVLPYTYRELQGRLAGLGHTASTQTLWEDLAALGLRTRGRRPADPDNS